MTITIELPPDLEERFSSEARAKGRPITQIVVAHLYRISSEMILKTLTAKQIDQRFEDAADLISANIEPLSDQAMTRESFYTCEDDWNR